MSSEIPTPSEYKDENGDIVRQISVGEPPISVTARFVPELRMRGEENNQYAMKFNRNFAGVPEAYAYEFTGDRETILRLAFSAYMFLVRDPSGYVGLNNAIMSNNPIFRFPNEDFDRILDGETLSRLHNQFASLFESFGNVLERDGILPVNDNVQKYAFFFVEADEGVKFSVSSGENNPIWENPDKTPINGNFSFWLEQSGFDLDPDLTPAQISRIFGPNSEARSTIDPQGLVFEDIPLAGGKVVTIVTPQDEASNN